MTWTVTISNPTYIYEAVPGTYGKTATDVPIAVFGKNVALNAVSEAHLRIEADVASKYSIETDDATNAVQLNSTVTIQKDAVYWFRGTVFQKPKFVNYTDGRFLEVTCLGVEGALLQAFCLDAAGNNVWKMESDREAVANLPLQATSAWGSFQGSTLWPNPLNATGLKCYTNGASDILYVDGVGSNLTAVATTIILSTTYKALVPRGWVKIDNEWIYYDGYDNSHVDTRYRLYNCVRGQLGTTAATHVEGATVQEKLGKEIAPAQYLLENDLGTGYISLRRGTDYDIHPKVGAFVLREDVIHDITGVNVGAHTFRIAGNWTALFKDGCHVVVTGSTGNDGTYHCNGDSTYGAPSTTITVSEAIPVGTVDGNITAGLYRATYSVYDEDSSINVASVPVTLNDVVTQLCCGPVAYGGAGFAAGDLDFDATTAAIKVNRYDYDPETKPIYAWDAIQDLLEMVGMEKEIGFWFKHSTGKLRLTVISNHTASFTMPHVERIESETSLEDVFSAVRVAYTDDQDMNRACPTYGYHQAATGAGASPDHYYSCKKDGESYPPAVTGMTVQDAAGNGGIKECTDGKPGSKLVAHYSHDPVGPVEHSQYYFGAGAPTVCLNRIKVTVGTYREIDATQYQRNADDTWLIRLEGAQNYNDATHIGTWFDLGCSVESKPSKEGTYAEGTFTVFAERRVNAVRVVWVNMAGPDTPPPNNWAPLHDIEIIADQVKYVLVQLTDNVLDKGKSAYLYGPASYEKLRGGVKAGIATGGSQRSLHWPIGAASHASAVSIGRLVLLTHLARWNQRRYGYEGIVPGSPELGITINCVETGGTTYTGVIREYALVATADGISIQGTILDAAASVID